MLRFLFFISLLFSFLSSQGQDDSLWNLTQDAEPMRVQAFSGVRLINQHTTETRAKGMLVFIIQHRFGEISGGWYEFFGLDNANTRIGLEYSLTNRFTFGIGRSSYLKVGDAFLKYRILDQQKGKSFFSLAAFTGFYHTAQKDYPTPEATGIRRISYVTQLLASTKVGKFTYQLAPSWTHFNYADSSNGNDRLVLMNAAKFKITKRFSVTGEYGYRLPLMDLPDNTFNYFGLGIEIETGGHEFQIFLTNTFAIAEKDYLNGAESNAADGELHIGFNITRNFQLLKKK
jgi:hypothetical protein